MILNRKTFLPLLFTASLGLSAVASELPKDAPAPTEKVEKLAETNIDWEAARKFWAFAPVKQPAPPQVANRSWPTQPLDLFILSSLEKNQLTPAPEASRQTLIRRLYFTLTGLPPKPSEIEAFLEDERPDAYERLVDRLLGVSTFGERMASGWLTLARYAEDQAHQVGDDVKEFYPNAYRYRQWVIDAFNNDMPYDQFIKLQLAADHFEPGVTNNLPALGFVGLGPKYYDRGRLDVMAEEWEDRVDTVTRTFLGLTVACARCHDHKFDPITTSDYYAMAGVFASVKMVNKALNEVEPATEEEKKKRESGPSPYSMHIIEDAEIKDLHVFIRGDVEKKGPVVERRFLQLLSHDRTEPFKQGSGRKDLAEKIADPENPLTARVMVNRVWEAVFSRPLVATPSNFGLNGEKPSHPELLDDLAARFVANGWSVKSLIREMVLSSTFRQASTFHPENAKIDAANMHYWRMPKRKLSVEMWRDAVLATAGRLKSEGGKSLELTDKTNFRRTVFARVSRLELNSMLMQFDYPDANVHAESRSSTITPLQKLFTLNSPFAVEQSAALAARLGSEISADSEMIAEAYGILYGRKPRQSEMEMGLSFLRRDGTPTADRWVAYTQALYASNEFGYID
ncbi:MAG: DUF1549 and DUF1553 domain-containing protein [Verrucomicrobiales bacterium]